MRIISDFHYYYDAVQREGQDLSLIYLRKQIEEELPFPFPDIYDYGRDISISQRMVGFCGKVYPVLELNLRHDWGEKGTFCFNFADVDAFVEANLKKDEIKDYHAKKWYRSWQRRPHKRHLFAKFFAECEEKKNAFESMFEEHPIFVAFPRKHLIYNASLKDCEFFRVFDTYTAFQELSMYLGSKAQPEKPIPEVSDKIMVGVKGFNKWSFRKEPGQKKKRGKKNG